MKHAGYFGVVAALMLVLPVMSITIEMIWFGPRPLIFLCGKWFVFWSIGIRLLSAGARQIISPSFTAQEIFKTDDAGAKIVVQELGFANVAIGIVAVVSLSLNQWIVPSALYGFIFTAQPR